MVSLPADLVVLSASTQAPERDVAADLSAVPRLLRGDPVVATLMGERDTTLAVPEAAQAVVVAALATFSERQPILVVTSAGLDAERLAGHNGLRSIESHLHTNEFVRVRIGVGKPPSAAQGAEHVLKRPPNAARELLGTAVETAADAVERIAADGLDAAMLWCHSLPT